MTKKTLLCEVMDALQHLDVDDQAKGKFRQMLEGVLGIGPRQDERVEYASQLVALKVSRATIKDRLMARFEVSRRHAYRLIEAALQRK